MSSRWKMTISKFFPSKNSNDCPSLPARFEDVWAEDLTPKLIFSNKICTLFEFKPVIFHNVQLTKNHLLGWFLLNWLDWTASFGHDTINFDEKHHVLPFLLLMGPKGMHKWWICGCFSPIITVIRNSFLLSMDPLDPYPIFFTFCPLFWFSGILLIVFLTLFMKIDP